MLHTHISRIKKKCTLVHLKLQILILLMPLSPDDNKSILFFFVCQNRVCLPLTLCTRQPHKQTIIITYVILQIHVTNNTLLTYTLIHGIPSTVCTSIHTFIHLLPHCIRAILHEFLRHSMKSACTKNSILQNINITL